MFKGIMSPNWAQIGEIPVGGNGSATPYGQADPTSSAARFPTSAMFGGVDSAQSDTGYKPQAGRADRLAANIPFVSGSYYNGRGSNV